MSLPDHHQLQLGLQSQENLRNAYEIDGQISHPPQINYFDTLPFFPNSNPSYATTFNVAGIAPDSRTVKNASSLDWNSAVLSSRNAEAEIKQERPTEERDLFFMNNSNSNIPSYDFFQPRLVSTGLGLSLYNTNYQCNQTQENSGNQMFLSQFGDEIRREFRRQDAEIEKYLKTQAEKLRVALLEKVHWNQAQTGAVFEEKVLEKLRAKDAEISMMTRRNAELEEKLGKLAAEVNEWQEMARSSERLITALKLNLRQVYAQSKETKEGCGDSEVEDTASCCNDRAVDFGLFGSDISEEMTCKVCNVRQVCMLLLPCRHLCLCKECEANLHFCPLCNSLKMMGVKVYI